MQWASKDGGVQRGRGCSSRRGLNRAGRESNGGARKIRIKSRVGSQEGRVGERVETAWPEKARRSKTQKGVVTAD